MKIKYVGDNPQRGIQYDWKAIRREYRKLKVPKEYFYPLSADFDKCGYHIALSDRARGKTTETLLLGMIMHKMYGTIIHYLRCSERAIRPYSMGQLFPTIESCGYIERITDGQYNSVYYYGHKWYYCLKDENGRRVETAPEHFMICMHLAESDNRKSSYNCPTGDLIIFDEFIELAGFGYNDYVLFNDLVSTIFRVRETCVIFMLSNTIDRNSQWFDELCMRDEINAIKQGETMYVETALGGVAYLEVMSPLQSETRLKALSRYFGFPNPRLAAITGRGAWATEQYQHIPEFEDPEAAEVLLRRIYLIQSGKLLRLQLMRTPLGVCVYVLPASRTYEDSIILTHGDITDGRYMFGFGQRLPVLDLIWRLYKANRFYYLTNSEGALVRSYIKVTHDKQHKMGI